MMNGINPNGPMNRTFAGMQAGGGIEAIESRVRQIEGMLSAIEGQGQTEQKPFQAYLNIKAPAGASTPALPPVKGSFTERFNTFQPVVEELTARYDIDKNLVNALITQESGFQPNVVSHAGAVGLMQLMPATAKTLGVDPHNPVQNLEGGIRHFKNLMIHYRGNIPLALAAYNAGMGAVKKYNGIPPYKETQNYVRSVLAHYLKNKA